MVRIQLLWLSNLLVTLLRYTCISTHNDTKTIFIAQCIIFHSEVFKKELYNPLTKETATSFTFKEVDIPIFEHMIRILYLLESNITLENLVSSPLVPCIDGSNAYAILEMANRFMIPSIVNLCEYYITHHIPISTFLKNDSCIKERLNVAADRYLVEHPLLCADKQNIELIEDLDRCKRALSIVSTSYFNNMAAVKYTLDRFNLGCALHQLTDEEEDEDEDNVNFIEEVMQDIAQLKGHIVGRFADGINGHTLSKDELESFISKSTLKLCKRLIGQDGLEENQLKEHLSFINAVQRGMSELFNDTDFHSLYHNYINYPIMQFAVQPEIPPFLCKFIPHKAEITTTTRKKRKQDTGNEAPKNQKTQ